MSRLPAWTFPKAQYHFEFGPSIFIVQIKYFFVVLSATLHSKNKIRLNKSSFFKNHIIETRNCLDFISIVAQPSSVSITLDLQLYLFPNM